MNFSARFLLMVSLLFIMPIDAEAQFGTLLNAINKGVTAKKRKKEKAAKAAKKIEENKKVAIETEGVTSDIHEKYQNNIVFSNKPIKKRREVESEFITETDILKPIYFRVYMDNSLYNYIIKKEKELERLSPSRVLLLSSYQIVLLLNGEEVINNNMSYQALANYEGLKTEKTTFLESFGTVNKKAAHNFLHVKRFKKILTEHEHKLTPGKHQLTVRITPYCSRDDSNDLEPYLSESSFEATLTLNVGNKVTVPSNNQFCLPQGELNNDKELFEAVQQLYNARMGVLKEDITISVNEWQINRHSKTGIILDRWVRVKVGGEGEEGCFYKSHIFTQEFDGTGYGKLYIEKSPDEEFPIPCDCLVDEY